MCIPPRVYMWDWLGVSRPFRVLLKVGFPYGLEPGLQGLYWMRFALGHMCILGPTHKGWPLEAVQMSLKLEFKVLQHPFQI